MENRGGIAGTRGGTAGMGVGMRESGWVCGECEEWGRNAGNQIGNARNMVGMRGIWVGMRGIELK